METEEPRNPWPLKCTNWLLQKPASNSLEILLYSNASILTAVCRARVRWWKTVAPNMHVIYNLRLHLTYTWNKTVTVLVKRLGERVRAIHPDATFCTELKCASHQWIELELELETMLQPLLLFRMGKYWPASLWRRRGGIEDRNQQSMTWTPKASESGGPLGALGQSRGPRDARPWTGELEGPPV